MNVIMSFLLKNQRSKQTSMCLHRKPSILFCFNFRCQTGLIAPDLPAHVDVDGFGSEALGQLVLGQNAVLPCTVQATIDIISAHCGEYNFSGLKVAVVGRSNIVGKPLAIELINRQSTVASFNSRSDLAAVDWNRYDVIVVATGGSRYFGQLPVY